MAYFSDSNCYGTVICLQISLDKWFYPGNKNGSYNHKVLHYILGEILETIIENNEIKEGQSNSLSKILKKGLVFP